MPRKNNSLLFIIVCKGLSNGDVGVARYVVFQEIRPGAGLKTGHFVKEKIGGATVLRLVSSQEPRREKNGSPLPYVSRVQNEILDIPTILG